MDSLITAAGRALSRCEASRWRSSGSSNERRRCGGGLRAGFVRVSCGFRAWLFGETSAEVCALRVCVRTNRLQNQSHRACPELVERGRLNLAHDAVLGLEFLHFESQGVGRTPGTLFGSRLQA